MVIEIVIYLRTFAVNARSFMKAKRSAKQGNNVIDKVRPKVIHQTIGRVFFFLLKRFYADGSFVPVHPHVHLNQFTEATAFNNFFGL